MIRCSTCGGTDREGGTVPIGKPDSFGNWDTEDCPSLFHAPGLIHVGANDGSEYLDDERALLLIEPQSSAYARLEDNHAGRPNVRLVHIACGSEHGQAELYLSRPDYSSSILKPALHLSLMPSIRFDGRTESVLVERLDRIVGDSPLYSELVIDVQGFELEVLKGAEETLKRISTLRLEVNTAEVYEGCVQLGELDAFLDHRGFERTLTDLHGGVWGDATYERRG